MAEVIDFLERLKSASTGPEGGLPAELANPLQEFYRLVGGAIAAAEPGKSAAPLLNALSAHLILALVEIDWMRTKRSYMPSDLRAQWEAIIASNLTSDPGECESSP